MIISENRNETRKAKFLFLNYTCGLKIKSSFLKNILLIRRKPSSSCVDKLDESIKKKIKIVDIFPISTVLDFKCAPL